MNKKGWIFLLAIVFFACGSGKGKNSDKSIVKKDSVQTKPAVDKSYLKKRPEEFREFFMLTDVVPFSGKVATKKDVNSKAAVFNMNSKNDPSHKALNIRLPFYAFLIHPNKPGEFIAVIQAETLKGDTVLGYKKANGLFGICNPREIEYFESQRTTVYQTPN
jgi:hypothetical protein